MSAPAVVDPDEALGRCVFSGREAKRGQRRGRVRFNVFLEKPRVQTLSVDRLDYAPLVEAVRLGERAAEKRRQPFYGWAVLRSGHAADRGRRVAATPRPDNPFHADVILPDTAVTDREEQKVHAQQLADSSSWRPRPDAASPLLQRN